MYKNITLVAFISAFMLTACGGGGTTVPTNPPTGNVSSSNAALSSSKASSSKSSLVASSIIASSVVPSSISSVSANQEAFSSSSIAVSSSSLVVVPVSSSVASSSVVAPPASSSIPSSSSVKSSSSLVASSSSSLVQSSSSLALSSSSVAVSSSSAVLSSSSSVSSGPASIYHVRGTFNGWNEGTLMSRVGSSDVYELCANFLAGDQANGGPRFKIDPNGAWGADSSPSLDYTVAAGWVKISYNSITKDITTKQNLAANCPGASSSSSSVVSSSVQSSSAVVSSSVKSSSSVVSSSVQSSSVVVSSSVRSSSSVISSSVRSSSIASSSVVPSSSSVASSSVAPQVVTHNAGQNCLSCHKASGTNAVAPVFTVAGTIYKTDGSAQTNATVSFADPTTSAIIVLKTDASGNFYTQQAIAGIKTTGFIPSIRTATGTKIMPDVNFSGACTSCHNGVGEIKLTID